MPEFSFIGAAYTAQSPTQDCQELINFYPEVDPTKGQGERGVVALYPTPGFFAKMWMGSNMECRGLHVIPGGATLFAVFDNNLVSVDQNFNGTIVANLASINGPVSMTDNGVSLYIVDGGSRYFYTWGTATFGNLVDGGFLGGSRCDVVDNFIIYSQPNGNLWGATSISSVVSPGLSFGRKDSAPDNIVTLIANKREIFILGETTSEVWVDAGLFPFPFQKLPGTNMQHGCAAASSLARLGESFAFLARDDRGQSVVVQMNGYSPVRISTHAIENEIQTYSTVADAVAYSYQQNGHEFYVLSFPTADKTWAYDLATGLWHRRVSTDIQNNYHRDRAQCGAFFQNLNIVGDFQDGLIYAASLTVPYDYIDINGVKGNILTRIRRCRHLTEDLNRVFYHSLQLQFQPGVGNQVAPGVDPQAMLRWSDDGGFTWSNQYWRSIGKVGKYKNRAIWRLHGQARDRVFELQITEPVFTALVSAELKFSPGAN